MNKTQTKVCISAFLLCIVLMAMALQIQICKIQTTIHGMSKVSKQCIQISISDANSHDIYAIDDRIQIYENEVINEETDLSNITINGVECSREIYDTVMELSANYPTVDPKVIFGIMYAESRFTPNVTSNGDCVGLMQISMRYHMHEAKKLGYDDLYDIRANIHTGYYILSYLLEDYTLVDTLHIYNEGWKGLSHDSPSWYAQQVINVIEGM